MIDYSEFNGFQIKDIGCDRPQKIKICDGMKFYTGSKFGDLVKLGRLLVSGVHVREAMKESGVTKYRAYRFARALAKIKPDLQIDVSPILKIKYRYKNVCCVCLKTFDAHKRDQNVCSPECRNDRFVNYQRSYNKTKRLTWKKKKGSLYENQVDCSVVPYNAAHGV